MEVLVPGSPELSPLFAYYATRYDRGSADSEGNLFLDDALSALEAKGICRASLHAPAFTREGAATRPSAAAYADAETRRLARRGLQKRYVEASGASRSAWIREQLNQERPALIGFRLPVTYPESFLNENAEWLDPERFDASASGHCVLGLGYSDARRAIHVQDSRGARFEQGRWWMGYRVIDSPLCQHVYALIS